uniref:Regulator of G protein signaling 9 binding protein n=1 Tax=Lepisosteus oculatus TaxID=7918 RepID=W5N0K6_LEPOC
MVDSCCAEELECKICYCHYNLGNRRPKVLQCCHRLCAKCLVKILDLGESPPNAIVCPFCRYPTSLPEEAEGSLPDDYNIVQALTFRVKNKRNVHDGSTELLLSPKRLSSFVSPSSCSSSNCLVITIVDAQPEAPLQPQSSASPIVEEYRSSSFDSIASVSRRWTVWNCASMLCQTSARILVWMLGLLYFSSLPLGVYLLIAQRTTVGVILVVACYRHLAASVGGSTDSSNLRDELRRTREKAQELAVKNRSKLTASLRDKSLPKEERAEMERLWVVFSSCLELFHSDMCKVFEMGQTFSLSSKSDPFVQTGMSGGTSDVAARALSLQTLTHDENLPSIDRLEQNDLEAEIAKVDKMIDNMEMKVNVLRWTVEAKSPLYADPLSTETSSVALLSLDEEDGGRCCDRSQFFVSVVLCGIAMVAVVLSVCVVYLT